ncbi:MAG: hypothetical protein WCO94_15835 [Verrucomicrobiota bacterium]
MTPSLRSRRGRSTSHSRRRIEPCDAKDFLRALHGILHAGLMVEGREVGVADLDLDCTCGQSLLSELLRQLPGLVPERRHEHPAVVGVSLEGFLGAHALDLPVVFEASVVLAHSAAPEYWRVGTHQRPQLAR